MTELLKGLADKAAEVLEHAGSKMGKVGDLGGDVAKSMTTDINTLLPAIRQAGYSVQGLDIDLALTPKFVVICTLANQISEDERKALLESIAESKVSTMAVKALFQLADIQKGLSVGSLVAKEVLVEVGLSPALRVRYREATTA